MLPRSALSTLPFLLALFLAGFAHREAVRQRSTFPVVDDLLYLPRAGVLRAAALGHTELAADLVFMRTVIHFGNALVTTRNYDWLSDHLDAVIALDPEFRAPYLFGSRATMYNGRTITNQAVAASNHFLEEGLKRFPNDWELSFALGCNYLFELNSDDPAQREQWRRMGGRWIRSAALAGGGPPWLANLAARIMSEEGAVDASIRYLEEIYLTTQDDKAKEAVGNLLRAKQRSNMAALAREGERFRTRWQKVIPYAVPDFYVLLGDPPSPRLDLPWLTADQVLEAEEQARLAEKD